MPILTPCPGFAHDNAQGRDPTAGIPALVRGAGDGAHESIVISSRTLGPQDLACSYSARPIAWSG